MVKATRSELIGNRRGNSIARDDGTLNRPQLVDESSDSDATPTPVPTLVPYELDSSASPVSDPVATEQAAAGEVSASAYATAHEQPTDSESTPASHPEPVPVTVEYPDDCVDPDISVQDQFRQEKMKKRQNPDTEVPESSRKRRTKKGISKSPGFDSSRFVSRAAQLRYNSFISRRFIQERRVDILKEDTWGYCQKIKDVGLEELAFELADYVKAIVCEFYANLHSEMSPSGVQVFVRGQMFEFSPTAINRALLQKPLTKAERRADATANDVAIDQVARVLSGKDKSNWRGLSVKNLPAGVGALLMIAACNLVPSSHKNHLAEKRARVVYKILQGIRFDVGQLVYEQVMTWNSIQNDDKRWLIFPRVITELLLVQGDIIGEDEDFIVADDYVKDPRTGEVYAKKYPGDDSFGCTAASAHEDPASGHDVIQLGEIRLPRSGDNSDAASYAALVDTAVVLKKLSDDVLKKLTAVVDQLIQNHPMAKKA
ncbi:uncharacterized protein LOC111832356 [Capsella rubella]|uniref:uncharacterized protein LOC111832356 n=1 Tax=Capsella rubella TaxID=81985 RepID=UPI000CD5A549|nr:uncharacterized protein LOC111832356 [Capsella rubella]